MTIAVDWDVIKEDHLILSGKSLIKIKNMICSIPGAHRITLGLDMSLGHLKPLGAFAQRANYGWTRLSLYLIETPLRTFANRAVPDQAALVKDEG